MDTFSVSLLLDFFFLYLPYVLTFAQIRLVDTNESLSLCGYCTDVSLSFQIFLYLRM